MKVLGIIPARGGSKGIKRKNVRKLGELPLIAYTINAAKRAKLLSEVVVSSDDDEILNIAKSLGVRVTLKRPDYLATDKSPTIDTLVHSLKYFQSKGIIFDAVCLLQVTYPFRTGAFIDAAIEKFRYSNFDSLISVLEVPHQYNPHWIFEEKDNGNLRISTGELEIISRRQDLPKSYFRDGSIYLTKTNIVLDQNSLYGNSIGYIESDGNLYVNIDSLEDWLVAEKLLKSNSLK